ncbi:MAG: hypothetical protein WD876_02150 [Candidatus Pacearchaeota archaeon]
MELKKSKNGIVAEYLPWLLIALAVLAIIFIALFVLRGQGEGFIDKIKDIFSGI